MAPRAVYLRAGRFRQRPSRRGCKLWRGVHIRWALQSGGVSAILRGRVGSHTGRTSEAREKSWRLIRTTRQGRCSQCC